ncbi:hypothetical protein [Actinoplanes sp. DH11]|uniref:hypothetical protein n=1 Tax=Actinoplanes sp. DH11 TaxID=2857011 RepID=UPI001E5AAE7B|nr:hypothetical protein [Actinoplanes sp. DH11]
MITAVCAVMGLAALLWVIRARADHLPRPRDLWYVLPLLLFWSGDALVGEGRSAEERTYKGILAGLLWLTLIVLLVRRRRWLAVLLARHRRYRAVRRVQRRRTEATSGGRVDGSAGGTGQFPR